MAQTLLKRVSVNHFNMLQIRTKATLPQLTFEYKALEPTISRDIMEIHHTKHHNTYVVNYNNTLEKLQTAVAKDDTATIISLAPALRFNGGGHINHSIFWETLTPSSTKRSGDFEKALVENFGSFEEFKKQLSSASVAVQGSGWGWLGFNPQNKKLTITSCANQDPLYSTTGLIPLFGIDVWEHAYYLQYKNVRADYVNAIFDVINWDAVSKRFADASA
ncbi:Manganese/iron superoxide dismutase, C-terminal,Manganese/iron superoxide dismutase, binding [Cinara cedri]|uniref:Superoxide dismutase n=1 Tax=Cinara cedri TaxID=506608 RepID=A0A5E4NS24_9HEMI|nr:Manganese/iron superoxide dismutase, C-terminal,Manganese/iron superoxide dismutase, binding [Cinara cedri]